MERLEEDGEERSSALVETSFRASLPYRLARRLLKRPLDAVRRPFYALLGRYGVSWEDRIRVIRLRFGWRNRRRIKALRNRHRGEQCVVLLTGPSVKEVDLSLLDNHPFVLGANGAYRLRASFRYYFCSSPNFYVPNQSDVERVTADAKVFSQYIRLRDDPHHVHLCLDQTHRLGDADPQTLDIGLLGFLPWGPTVLLDLVIPTCLWMGFAQIVLVGADYTLRGYRRFYDGDPDAPTRLQNVDMVQEMNMAHEGFSVLKAHLEEHRPDVRIVNCSPRTNLPHFPVRALAEVL